MKHKFFSLDKNYLLKEAQLNATDRLLADLVNRAANFYNLHHNPLGIEDDTIKAIKAYRASPPLPDFEHFYTKMAVIYRYFHGETQLGFIWDGRSHVEYYEELWENFFVTETNKMMQSASFLKIILELTVFASQHQLNSMLVYRFSSFIKEHFQVQVYKKKGLKKLKTA